jgi:hypothetical protein
VVLGGFNIPVFVETVEEQRPHEVAALITAAQDIGDYDHPLDVLEQVAIDQWQLDRVFRQPDADSLTPKGSRLCWQGELLLMWK